MTTNSPEPSATRTPESYRQHITQALDHARDLIAAARRVLGEDKGYANIAYHLAILSRLRELDQRIWTVIPSWY